MRMNRKWLYVVLALAGLASSVPVQAGAVYAVSTLGVSNLGITFSSPAASSGFTITTDSAGMGVAGTGNANTMDAAASCLGCGYSNVFAAHGLSATPYSYADALIGGAILNGTASASGIAETSVNAGSGSATAGNSFRRFISLANNGTQIGFNFSADPLLTALLAPGGVAGAANISFSMTLMDMSGHSIFSWTPNGILGDVVGGTEISDPFNLNLGLSVMNPELSVYDPVAGRFGAVSAPLARGSYQLSISMFNSAFVQGGTVPEPGVLPLLAGGLASLLFARRKRIS